VTSGRARAGLLTIAVVILAVVSVWPVIGAPAGTASSLLPSGAAAVTTIVTGPPSRTQPISPAFWGINWDAGRATSATDASSLSATPVRDIRYPGGNLADRFNYTSGVITNDDGSTTMALTTAAGFVTFCRSIGCQALLELPAEINRPKTAAYYVKYVEATLHFRPAYWEIGNEPYGWTHTGLPWSMWRSTDHANVTPLAYAQIVRQYSLAIRAIDPTTPILALSAGQEHDFAQAWIQSVLQVNGPNLSGIAVHSYAGWNGQYSPDTLAGFFSNLRATWSLPNVLAHDSAYIRQYCTGCPNLPLFVDEINSAYGSGAYAKYTASFDGTLFMASEIAQALNARAPSLEWFAYNANFPGSFEYPPGHKATQYYLFADLLSKLRDATVPTVVRGLPGVYAATTTNGTADALLVSNVNTTSSTQLDLLGSAFSPSSPLTETLWTTGTPAPRTVSLAPGRGPILPSLSVAVITGTSALAPVTFWEKGLPTAANWSVVWNGTAQASTSPTLTFFGPPGTYGFSLPPADGYVPQPEAGTIALAHRSLDVPVLFSPASGDSGLLRLNFSSSVESLSLGLPVTFRTAVSGGQPPYSYEYSGLPPGCISMNAATLTCTPGLAGSFNVEVTVRDGVGNRQSAFLDLAITSGSPVIFGLLRPPSWASLLGPALLGMVGGAAVASLAWGRLRRPRRRSRSRPVGPPCCAGILDRLFRRR
jgi:hypothetical protein